MQTCLSLQVFKTPSTPTALEGGPRRCQSQGSVCSAPQAQCPLHHIPGDSSTWKQPCLKAKP